MSIKKLIASALTAGFMLSFIPAAALADTAGWQGSYSDGWKYYTSAEEYVKSDWKQIGGKWYHFNASGIMETGWIQDGGKWYYLKSNGQMTSDSWELLGGKLYHFNKSGVMETNKWIDCGEYTVYGQTKEIIDGNEEARKIMSQYIGKKLWRYVGSDGAAYTGWHKVGGEWYHFNTDINLYDVEKYHSGSYAVMSYGTFYDEEADAYYRTDGNGKYLKNGWTQGVSIYCPQDWYYFGSDGKMYIGWHNIGGKWYFFGGDDYETGFLRTGWIETYTNGYEVWITDKNGALQTNGWIKNGEDWFYARSNGSCYHDQWKYIGGTWYYFDNVGRMIKDKTNFEIGGKGYDFNSSGACTNPSGRKITGWYERIYDSLQRYEDSNGNPVNNWNYFDSTGKKIVDTQNYLINGKYYDFDSTGICKNPFDGRTEMTFS